MSFQILKYAVLLLALPLAAQATPQNVIIVIGDGMGPEHEEAARLYSGAPLAWDSAPNQAQVTTNSLTGLTDSAAAASAIATGLKYNAFAISQDTSGVEHQTVLEHYKDMGKSTGLVTTSYIEDATPAAFAAHEVVRFLTGNIVDDYLNDSRPNVLLGSINPGDMFAGFGIDPTRAANAGYQVATTRAELLAIDTNTATHVSGQFGVLNQPSEYEYSLSGNTFYDTNPFLSEMTDYALDMLEEDPDGFFLLVEHEGADLSGHDDTTGPSRVGAGIFSTLELSNTVQGILDWISGRADPTDTLLIVTADHETGGLAIQVDNGVGNLPTVTYSTNGHTPQNVNAYAWGPNASLVSGTIDNTDLFTVAVPEPGVAILLLGALVAVRNGRPASVRR